MLQHKVRRIFYRGVIFRESKANTKDLQRDACVCLCKSFVFALYSRKISSREKNLHTLCCNITQGVSHRMGSGSDSTINTHQRMYDAKKSYVGIRNIICDDKMRFACMQKCFGEVPMLYTIFRPKLSQNCPSSSPKTKF